MLLVVFVCIYFCYQYLLISIALLNKLPRTMSLKGNPIFRENVEEFWEKIEELRRRLIVIHSCNRCIISSDYSKENPVAHDSKPNELSENGFVGKWSTREVLLQKIQHVFVKFIDCIIRHEPPVIAIPDRTKWNNMSFSAASGLKMNADPSFTLVRFSSISSVKRLSLILHCLSKVYCLLQKNVYSTKRELYYQDVNIYGTQSVVDKILDDIACLFGVQKIDLHVLTTSKGFIAGDLWYKDAEGNYIDCSAAFQGVLIPNEISGITNIQSTARFILVVEKDAVFQTLLDGGIKTTLHPCILITGRGFPDANTRQIIRKLYHTLQIPIMGLVDADPYGIEILCTYRYGSLSMSYDVENLAVPQIQWLGVHPTDMERLQLPENAVMALTESDIGKAKSLLSRPYFQCNDEWSKQIKFLLLHQKKTEIEGLEKIADHFLCNVYLPSKIRLGGWI